MTADELPKSSLNFPMPPCRPARSPAVQLAGPLVVYVVLSSYYDNVEVRAVYARREDAERDAEAYRKINERSRCPTGYNPAGCEVVECRVKEPGAPA